MMTTTLALTSFRFLAVATTAATLAGACKKEDPQVTEQVPARQSVAQAQDQEAQPALSSHARASINQMLAAYEQMRAKLARDEVAAVSDDAAAVQRTATAAATNAPEALRSHLTNIAAAAGRIKEMPKDDTDAVRRTFGDVSSAVVVLVAAESSLQQGRHVFECPMAQGYKKWVQTSASISNPYMGTKMPGCGSDSHWGE